MKLAALCRWSLFACVLTVASTAASGQSPEPIDGRVLQLYAAADYEQALAVLGNSAEPAAHFYRALCLLGLGRLSETEAALKLLVLASPEFTVSAEEVPPRLVALLTEKRRELLPGVLRRLFAQAREQYQSKAYDRAVPEFERILALSTPADVKGLDGVEDLRVLAEGFIDLSKSPAPQPATPGPPAPAAPQAPAPAARPRATAPVAIKQEIPAWPAEAGRLVAGTTGVVQVQISSTGRVTSATMVKRIHPRYDVKLLAETNYWEYQPATLNGMPVDSESVVEVRVTR
jgi:tetratricopeptide (TPR) repeat protein